MRILVCFKVTPDYEALREADWAAGPAGRPETRYVRRLLNCFDESALELALRLRDAAAGLGLATELEALSVGGEDVEPYLRTLLALGYRRAVRVRADADVDFAPHVTAALVGRYVQQADRSDVVLLGCRGGPGGSGTVPFLVAETLGWPCVAQLVDLEVLSAERLRVTATVDQGLMRATVRTPCVLAVGNAVVSHLRAPTLTQRLARRDEPPALVTAAELGVDVDAALRRGGAVLTGLERIDRSRAAIIVEGDTLRARVLALVDRHLQRVLDTL